MYVATSRVPDELPALPAHSYDKVLLLADRFQRAEAPHAEWAKTAKKCVDYVEGKQWSEADLAKLAKEERPALTFNKIGRLVRLTLGYHRNNRTDMKYLPGLDGTGADNVATVLTDLAKQISEMSSLPYVDTEVFMDGIIGGRGYYDARLDFEKNDFGDVKWTAKDPFSIRLDPDGTGYDLNESGFLIETKWLSLEDVEFLYGQAAAMMLWPLVGRGGYYGGIPNSIIEFSEEITPWRGFGGQQGMDGPNYMAVEAYIANCYDRARKNIRLVEMQHYVRQMMWHFVDLETGDRQPIPEHWTKDHVQKTLAWAQDFYATKGKLSPLRVQRRPGKRVRWTVMCGDIVVYDDWSPYETFTLVGYFPWFRRGKTRGMAEDLLDPQDEINKRRSATVDIVTRTAHSGWKYHKKSMSEPNKQRLEEEGAMPGVNIEWDGDQPWHEPKKIEPGVLPVAMEKLEEKGSQDLLDISGINESALGDLDRVQSGRAIEARQRQSVLAIQIYMDNMTRTKQLSGYKTLELVQNHYTEERTFRVLGADGQMTLQKINTRDAVGEILNDVTVGRYIVALDETPLAASFKQAQFEELMEMIEKGVIPADIIRDIVVDASSAPQKEVIKRRVTAVMAAAGIPTGDDVAANPAAAAQAVAAGAGGGAPGAVPGGVPPAAGAPLAAPGRSIVSGPGATRVQPSGAAPA